MGKTKLNSETAWELLTSVGLSLSQNIQIRNAFHEQFKEMSNVIKDGEFYKNTNVDNYLFSTEEEAEFAEHLFKYMKGEERNRIIDVFKILNTVIGKASDWKF